jgi:hypothetical protein
VAQLPLHTIHVDLQVSDIVYARLSVNLPPVTSGKAGNMERMIQTEELLFGAKCIT